MDEKAKPTPKSSKKWMRLPSLDDLSYMGGCKAFSIQNINEYKNM
jgi:hypothetical protein